MNEEIDWSKAPTWADRVVEGPCSMDPYWANARRRIAFDGSFDCEDDFHVQERWETLSVRPESQADVDQRKQTRSAIIELAWKQCGIQGDAIRQLATALVADGYRKFEIVDEEQ